LVEAHSELEKKAEERGVNLTYTPYILKACVAGLKKYPILNSSLDEENDEIVKKEYYNLGFATDTDAGLMVPVVEDVDEKDIFEVAEEVNRLAEKARERDITPEEMRGGTFTVTNVGTVGGEYATPIINYPEVAILATGAIKKRPRVVENEVVPRHTMTLSLSIDHRVVDGAEAARFTNVVKRHLENPELVLVD
ncbi:MAG: 2-oxo acid dehydrogenase subunit E2, partial [Halobacteria archaeon]|nr:2-oxo acid dehydrogenase subunit E2 [Halobacteria archaeon]